jgi:hypothetical protein
VSTVAQFFDENMNHLSARHPARLAVVLNGFGGASIILAILFFGGSFYVENEIGRAFCLGAFFSGLLGGIVLFGFAKVIDMLDAIRQQTLTDRPGEASDSGAGPNASAHGGSS